MFTVMYGSCFYCLLSVKSLALYKSSALFFAFYYFNFVLFRFNRRGLISDNLLLHLLFLRFFYFCANICIRFLI